MYKIKSNSLLRVADNALIPQDEANNDYRQYLIWLEDGNAVEPEFSDEEIRTALKTKVKEDAYVIITGRYPTWKQNNMLARWLELAQIVEKTEEETAEMDAYRAVWEWIKTIRLQSNTFELEIEQVESLSSYSYEYITN